MLGALRAFSYLIQPEGKYRKSCSSICIPPQSQPPPLNTSVKLMIFSYPFLCLCYISMDMCSKQNSVVFSVFKMYTNGIVLSLSFTNLTFGINNVF